MEPGNRTVRLSIRLLGGFQAELKGNPITSFKSDKVRALLAYLLVEADQTHRRDALAGLLWPDSPHKSARTNLRSVLANLRKVIDDKNSSPPHLMISRESIQFNQASDHWLDVAAFQTLASNGGPATDRIARWERAAELYQGPFLHGFSLSDSIPFEEWAIIKREQIGRKAIDLLWRLATFYEQRCEYERTQRLVWRMVELEPWNEEAHQLLMRVLALAGQRSAALAQYDACRRILAEELEVEPNRETERLYANIRDGDLNALRMKASAPASIPRILPTGEQRPVFVDRQRELTHLENIFKKNLAGQGQAAFVIGGPGSGKTALIGEFISRTMRAQADLIPLMGSCKAYTGIGDPYQPFQEILGLLSGDFEDKNLGGQITTQHARRLWVLFPSFVQILVENGPDLIGSMTPGAALLERARRSPQGIENWKGTLSARVESSQAGHTGTPLQQIDLFDQYTRVLKALARQRPLIVVIDDLQWADTGTTSLLFHLGEQLASSRILFIGAYRPSEVALGRGGERHPLEPVVFELQRIYGEARVDLDRSDGREFVQALLDNEPNRLDASFREKLYHHTEGQPLFTIELLRDLQDRGDLIRDESGRWILREQPHWEQFPTRAEAVIAERINRLPPNLREAPEVASVEGDEFTAEIVSEVLSIDKRRLVRELSEQLNRKHRLVSEGRLQRLDGRRLSRYQFRHQLFQQYLYEALDESERAYLHEAIGKALESLYQEGAESSGTYANELARHFEGAGDLHKAIEYLRVAGVRAERLSASEEAATHFRHALDLSRNLPDSSERAQTELGLIMGLGSQIVITSGYISEEANQLYTRARQLIREIGAQLDDPSQVASQLMPPLLGIGAFYGHRGEYHRASQVYEEVSRLALAAGDPLSLMIAHWSNSYLLINMGHFTRAREQLAEALEIYDPKEHQWMATAISLDMGVSCLSWMSWASFFLGYPEQALVCSQEAIQLAERLEHPYSQAVAITLAAYLHAYMYEAEEARVLAEQSLSMCREYHIQVWLGWALMVKGAALAWQGNHDDGIQQLEKSASILESHGVSMGYSNYLCWLAEIRAEMGEADQGMSLVNEGLKFGQTSGEYMYQPDLYRVKGDLYLQLGDQNQAKDCYRQAITRAKEQHSRMFELRAAIRLSRLLSQQGKRDEARAELRGIYDWFTEGFRTRDLQEAAQLLEEL